MRIPPPAGFSNPIRTTPLPLGTKHMGLVRVKETFSVLSGSSPSAAAAPVASPKPRPVAIGRPFRR